MTLRVKSKEGWAKGRALPERLAKIPRPASKSSGPQEKKDEKPGETEDQANSSDAKG